VDRTAPQVVLSKTPAGYLRLAGTQAGVRAYHAAPESFAAAALDMKIKIIRCAFASYAVAIHSIASSAREVAPAGSPF